MNNNRCKYNTVHSSASYIARQCGIDCSVGYAPHLQLCYSFYRGLDDTVPQYRVSMSHEHEKYFWGYPRFWWANSHRLRLLISRYIQAWLRVSLMHSFYRRSRPQKVYGGCFLVGISESLLSSVSLNLPIKSGLGTHRLFYDLSSLFLS